MAEFNKFNQFGNRQTNPDHCAECEAMLADALDRSLLPEDQARFDRHLATCPDCSLMFADAKIGAELLATLNEERPVPSSALLQRILTTTGPATELPAMPQNTLLSWPVTVPAAASFPMGYQAPVLPFRQRLRNALRPQTIASTLAQPRLAMTAAMAFFSIALTLNLTGVRLTELRASDFTPSNLQRSFYNTNARVARSIDNLRVVYELESRVRDLQRGDDYGNDYGNTPAPAQNTPKHEQKAPEQQKHPSRRSGSSNLTPPQRGLEAQRSHEFTAAALTQPDLSPRSGQEPRKSFVIFTPTVFSTGKQGGRA